MRKSIQNLSILTKVALCFAIVCLTTIVLGLFATQRMSVINDGLIDVGGNWLPSVKALGRVAQQTERYRANILAELLATNDRARAESARFLETARSEAL